MSVVSVRTFTVVFAAVVGVAAVPHELLACGHERDCKPNPDPVEIGVLPGYQTSRVKQINNRGDIVGQAVRTTEEPTQQAVLWHRVRGPRHVAEELPALDGFVRGDARGFATDRIPVGVAYDPGSGALRAVAWRMDWEAGQRVAVDLEPPPGFTDAQAFSGNGMGFVAGEAANPKELVDGLSARHAVIWHLARDGGVNVCDLGVPDGFLTSSANSINARGVVVGTARGRSASRSLVTTAFLWRPVYHRRQACGYEAIPLASTDAGFTIQSPAINDRGDVVAQGSANGSIRALLWRRHREQYGEPELLPIPDGYTDALARAINEPGDIVGTTQRRVTGGLESRVVLWRRALRGWTVQVLSSPSNANIISSEYLNDRGDVIADTTLPPAGSSGAYLWLKMTRQHCEREMRREGLTAADAEIETDPTAPVDMPAAESPQEDTP